MLQVLLQFASRLRLCLLLFELCDNSTQLCILEHAAISDGGRCIRLESADRTHGAISYDLALVEAMLARATNYDGTVHIGDYVRLY